MPIYVYRCPECSFRFEKLKRHQTSYIQDEQRCPKCTAQAQRQITRAAFTFVGGSPTSGPTPITRVDKAKGIDDNELPFVGRQGELRDGKTGKIIQ